MRRGGCADCVGMGKNVPHGRGNYNNGTPRCMPQSGGTSAQTAAPSTSNES